MTEMSFSSPIKEAKGRNQKKKTVKIDGKN